jgi:hypothetical protein
MPEVKASPATPDKSPSRSRCNHAIGIRKFSALGGEIRQKRACAALCTAYFSRSALGAGN